MLLEDIKAAVELLEIELDAGLLREALANITKLEIGIERLEIEGLFDEHSQCFGAYLIVTPANRNEETIDWLWQLVKMYGMWAQKHNYKVKCLSEGYQSDKLESVVLAIAGRYAYGYLKSETGNHNSVQSSETCQALVEVIPILDDSIDFQIRSRDLKIETSPHRGNVNRIETWVRAIHLPTGMTVYCDGGRSQIRNKENALKILTSKVWLMAQEATETDTIKSDRPIVSLIREYIFYPSPLVKDCRTGVATTAIAQVLDGDIYLFVKAYLDNTVLSIQDNSNGE